MGAGIGAYFRCYGSNIHWKVLDFNKNLDYVTYDRMHRTKPVDRPTPIKMIETITCAAIRTRLIPVSVRHVGSICVLLLLAGCIQQEDAEEAAKN